jgi:hypothetical protein
MATERKTGRKALTAKQAVAAEIITSRVNEGEPFSKELVTEAHDEAYELNGDRKKASTYAGKNLRSSGFLAALDLEAPEAQSVLKEVLWTWLLNYREHPDLAKTAAKILAKATFGEKISHHIYEDAEFADKSVDELEFYARNALWPNAEEKEYFARHKTWPEILEGNKKPN